MTATFLHTADGTFLNHGSFGATPRELLDIQADLREQLERQPVDFLVRRLPDLLDEARAATAGALRADAAGLVFVRNATEGIAAVLQSVDLQPGDEILYTNHGYNAVHRAILRECDRTGARPVRVSLPWPVTHADALRDAVVRGLTDRTGLLIVDAITSPTALVLPVGEIVEAARARGVPVLVDGAHALGQIDVDVGALAPDWWVGNLHKWMCAPKGAAVLWTAPRHRAATTAAVPSHGSGIDYHFAFDWPGTFDPSAWLTVPAALALHEALGGARLRAAHHALVQQGRVVVAEAVNAPLPHPDDPALYAAMAAIPLDLPAALCVPLNHHLWTRHRVEVPVSPLEEHAVLRISGFAAYNTPEDYARLAAVLPQALEEVSAQAAGGL